ncbi:glycosyltransferase [Aeromonas sp. HZM]|uniref:glycosyltransferase n=1 Tax=Aeromonas sp. HZM TaxID=1454008 RepID=UPI001362D318|nr:glycosyltransferase [Aeromonas sp. HZM]
MNKRLILIGPTKLENEEPQGSVVLFEELLGYLKREKVDFELFSTTKKDTWFIFRFISFLVATASRDSIYSFHSSRDYIYLLPIIKIFCFFSKSKISLRKFGQELYDSLTGKRGFIERLLSNLAIKLTDQLYVETKALISKLESFGISSKWIPNTRKQSQHITDSVFSGKGIFIGRVSKLKGINDLISLSLLLNDISIDIYGSLTNDFTIEEVSTGSLRYKGYIDNVEIYKTLSKYDFLILPSYQEGYPGVIVEAFACGVPCIAYNVGGLSEMIDGNNGVLIEASKVELIGEAIKDIKVDYKNYTNNALSSFSKYNTDVVIHDYLVGLNEI